MTTEVEIQGIGDAITKGAENAKAVGRKARRRAFRLSFQGFLMDLVRRPAAAPEAPRVEKPADAPRGERPAEAKGGEVERRADEAPRHEAKAARAEARDDAPEGQRRVEEASEGETADDRPADEIEAADAPPADGETAGDEASKIETAVRVRIVHADVRVLAGRPVERGEIEAIVAEIRALFDDADVRVEDLGAAVVRIAEVVGIERAEAAQAVEAAKTDDAPARRAPLVRALERIERILSEKVGDDRPRRAGDEKPAEARTPEADPKGGADDALGRLLKKIEAAVRRIETPEPKESRVETPRDEPRPEAPRAEARRLENDAARRVPLPAVEAAPPAAVAVAAVPSADPGAVHAAARSRNPVVRAAGVEAPWAGEAAKAGAQGRSAGQGEGHYASSEYRRNESQRAREAPRPAAYRTPVEENVLREVVRRARFVVENGKSEATIELKPEFLGRLKIKVVVEDGRAQVTLRAENAAVRLMLEANLDDLRRSLAASGLEVDLLEVAAGGAGGAPADERGEGEAAGERAGGGEADEILDEVEVSAEKIESIRNEALRSSVSYVA